MSFFSNQIQGSSGAGVQSEHLSAISHRACTPPRNFSLCAFVGRGGGVNRLDKNNVGSVCGCCEHVDASGCGGASNGITFDLKGRLSQVRKRKQWYMPCKLEADTNPQQPQIEPTNSNNSERTRSLSNQIDGARRASRWSLLGVRSMKIDWRICSVCKGERFLIQILNGVRRHMICPCCGGDGCIAANLPNVFDKLINKEFPEVK